MHPVEFVGQTQIVSKDQDEYRDLPARMDNGIMTCCWGMNWRQRIVAVFTGRIYVEVLLCDRKLQPMRLNTKNPHPRYRSHV